MTPREKLILGLCAVALVVLLAVGGLWLQGHDAETKAKANDAAQKQVIADQQKIIDQAKAQQTQIADTLQKQLAAIAAQRTIVVTPQQAVAALPAIVPNLHQPVQLQTVPATATAPATQSLVIPEADIPAFQKYKLDCDEKGARLDACSLTTASRETQLTATQAELTATESQRDGYKAASKGGTFLQRLTKKAKCMAIGGGASAAGAWLDKQQPARGALIGATAGGIGCEIF